MGTGVGYFEKASSRAGDLPRNRFAMERENPGEEEGSNAGRSEGGGRFNEAVGGGSAGSISSFWGEEGRDGRILALLGEESIL